MLVQVFPDLSIEIVHREQRIVERPLGSRRYRLMDESTDPMQRFCARRMGDSSRVGTMHIGPEMESWPACVGEDSQGIFGDESGEGSFDAPRIGLELHLELGPASLLLVGHTSLAPEGDMIDAIDELGLGADQEMDIVGEELGDAEALETIRDEVLRGEARGGETGVEGEGLASGSGDAVGDGVRGGVDSAAEGAEAGGGDEAQQEVGIGDMAFSIVVETEGLGGEGMTAGVATEARDEAEGGGEIGAPRLEVGIGGSGVDAMMDTVCLGAEGERVVVHAL
jgi:hypothetical protein